MEEAANEPHQRRNMKYVCWAVLLLSGVVFGSSFSIIKIAVADGAHPLGLTFWFAAISTVIVGIVSVLRGNLRHLTVETARFCMVWGVLGTVIPTSLFFYAAQQLPAGIISLAIALVPILTYLGAIVTRQDEANFGRMTGIVVGAIAATILLTPGTSLPDPQDTSWVLLPLLAALCFAIEHLYFASKAPVSVPLDLLVFLMFLSASLLLLPIIMVTSTFVIPSWPFQQMELAIIAVALVTTIDYFFFAFLIARAGPVFTSQAAYVVTLSGVLWGIALFDESHSLWIWIALILLFAGIYLVRPRTD